MSRCFGLGLKGLGDDRFDILLGDLARFTGPLQVGQSIGPWLEESPSPLAEGLSRDAEHPGDILLVQAFGAGQDDSRSMCELLDALGWRGPSHQGLPLVTGQGQFRFASAFRDDKSPVREAVPCP